MSAVAVQTPSVVVAPATTSNVEVVVPILIPARFVVEPDVQARMYRPAVSVDGLNQLFEGVAERIAAEMP